MDTRALHLLVELWGCDVSRLDDVSCVRESLIAAARAAGATVVGELFHRYAPQGVSGVVLIEESHLSVHTWPEAGYAAVDFFTCGDLKPEPAATVLRDGLAATRLEMQLLERGLRAAPWIRPAGPGGG